MGTDIHGVIQARYSSGEYTTVGPIENERNYLVFAILADVRNGFGFAGCRTHEPITPISAPRGLPADLGNTGRYTAEGDSIPHGDDSDAREDWGDHSFSWVTLQELLDWPGWDRDLQLTGVVERAEYERVQREGGPPRSWSGMVSGSTVIATTTEDLMEGRAPDNWNYVQMRWTVPLKERCGLFWAWLQYQKLKHGWRLERDPAAIRLVFGFDS